MSQKSRTPLYIQIRDYLLDNINKGQWKSNDKIPSENELAAKFNVSRLTIKNALSELIKEGLIYRIQGKGTFISEGNKGEPPIYLSEKKNPLNLVAYLTPRLDNLITSKLLSGIETELSKNGYRLLFCTTNDSKETETKLIKDLIEMGVKGIIVYPSSGNGYNEEILKLTLNNFPLVVVDRYLRGVETNCVCSNNTEGAKEAIQYLIDLNHKRIGFLSTNNTITTSIEDRLNGYEKALSENNIPIDHRLLNFGLDMEEINSIYKNGHVNEKSKETIKTFLKENSEMTAIFAVHSAIGLTLIESARELGLDIPKDLSVVFFDDYELSSFSRIRATCVSQQVQKLGTESANLLLSLIENPYQQRKKIVLSTSLIKRDSCTYI